MTISAVKDEVVEEKEKDYIRKERRTGNFQRCFRINNVKEDDITAEYNEGILKVILPKEVSGKKKKRVIDIN